MLRHKSTIGIYRGTTTSDGMSSGVAGLNPYSGGFGGGGDRYHDSNTDESDTAIAVNMDPSE
jgi:hypothetical protein